MEVFMITAQALIEKFQYALDNNWGYIWGTAGVMWTAVRQAALEKTTDENRAMSRKYGKKWIGHTVADCSGLFVWVFRQFDLQMSHISSNIYISYCTSTKGKLTAELKQTIRPGSAVFTGEKAGKHPHVGLYIGNNTVIEAKGTIAGVVTSNLTDKKWTFYGELKNVDYNNSEIQNSSTPADSGTGFPENPGWHPTIRRGSKGQDVIDMQTMLYKLGYGLGADGIDGDYGRNTEKAVKEFQSDNKLTVDGVCGPMTWDALEKAVKAMNEQPKENLYTVCIHHLDKTQADAMKIRYPDCVVTEEKE
jgi:hypothetical protein